MRLFRSIPGRLQSLPRLVSLAVALLICSLLQGDPRVQPTPLTGSPELRETLDSLNTLGSLLMLGAHPDDENTGVIAYFARGRHIRTAYLAATRGEGGQNLIGPEQGDLMGLIRTQELLEARRVDGGEQFFTRAIDFGFSKSPEETYEKWGREVLLEDIVRVIRRFRPDVLVSRFPPAPGSGGHGQHTAVGHIAAEALAAAADPKRFPEQIREGLKPWQARRLVWNTFNFSPAQEQDEAGRVDRIRLEIGDFNPVLGKSYVEIAGESRSKHRSQSMGTNQRKGEATVYFAHVAGEPAAKDLFDGVDTSWARVQGGETVGRLLAQARDELNPTRPAAILPLLVEAYAALEKLDDPWVPIKRAELLHAIELASGLWVDASAERWDATPGAELPIELDVINRSDFPLRWKRTEIRGVALGDQPGSPDVLPYNHMLEKTVTVKIPAGAAYSQPYWLREPPQGSHYQVKRAELIGRPEGPPLLEATFYLETARGVELAFPTPVVYRWVDRAYGERLRSEQIVPQVAVSFLRPSLIFADASAKTVSVRLHGNEAALEGTVTLETPAGWAVSPASAPFQIARRGQDLTVNFELTPPQQDAGGKVAARVRIGGTLIDRGMQQIEYEHIPIQMVYPEAVLRVERVNLTLLSKNIGYVMGAGDTVPEALEQIGAKVTLLSETDLASGDLSRFDAIVTGVRALNTRPDLLAARERLLEYMEQGGTVVMQYNTMPFGYGRGRRGEQADAPSLSPYPMTPSHDRVTDEDAAVSFPIPDHPLLQAPNHITAKDFEGWVQERGLYFMSEWDDHFDAVLSCHDPGEPGQLGGQLYTRYGKGAFIFTGYAWFRQLPAGVPGAYRIFANLVSAGKVK
jgi:LmbE family N-acetylglucosaminyl deacetylase